MTDEDLRRRARTATAQGDPASLIASAQALARSSLFDEAAHVLLRARALGATAAQVRPVQEKLAPASLAAFAKPRSLNAPPAPGRYRAGSWSADGGTLFTIEGGSVIAAWDPRSGRRQIFTILENAEIDVVAPDLDGKRLAVAGKLGIARRAPELSVLEVHSLLPVENESSLLSIMKARTARFERSIGRGHRRIVEVGFSGEQDVVFVAEARRARAYRVGRNAGDTPLWAVKADHVGIDPFGSAAAVVRDELTLFAPLSQEPLARRRLEGESPVSTYHPVSCAGDRAFAVRRSASRLYRVGRDETVGVALRRPYAVNEIAPSPSGRFAAVIYHHFPETVLAVDLVDFEARKVRAVRLKEPPYGLSWSPSGRTLAVVAGQGAPVLIEAG